MLQNLLRRWDFAHRGICDERRRQQLGISLNAGVDVRERGKGKGKSGLVPSCPATVPSPASTHEIALAPKLWKPNALTERATGCSRGGHFWRFMVGRPFFFDYYPVTYLFSGNMRINQ